MNEITQYRYDIKQNTEEWHKARDLRLTASHATAIMSNGKGLKSLVKDLVAKHYSSGVHESYTNTFNNVHLQRGHDYENNARMMYEIVTGNSVTEVGLVEFGKYVSVSPDGLIDDVGLLEIKNINDKDFMQFALDRKIDSNHRNQMQMQMFVTGRKWCDYFMYNPNFNPSYVLVRVKPDYAEFERINEGLKNGIRMIEEAVSIFDNIFETQKG